MICRDTPSHGWVVGWSVGQWVGSGQITKNLINLDLVEIIQFCLKIYDLWRHPDLWVGVWLVEWMLGQWVGPGQITNYRINLDLIRII